MTTKVTDMDRFGIGNMLQGAARCMFQQSRGSGRTTELLHSLKDGDRVVFTNSTESERVKRLANEMGIRIETQVIDPSRPDRLTEFGTPAGHLILDHSWVEAYYMHALEEAGRSIDRIQRELSGPGMAHVETRLAARERARWTP